jgi:hypothetical protein
MAEQRFFYEGPEGDVVVCTHDILGEKKVALYVLNTKEEAEDVCNRLNGSIADLMGDNETPGPSFRKLQGQELNTILAALRFYQAKGQGDPANRSDEIHAIATDDDADISMDEDGIDGLCESLNCGTVYVLELPVAVGG